MPFSTLRDSAVPFEVIPDQLIPIPMIGDHMRSPGNRLVLLALQGKKSERSFRLARMSSSSNTQFLACEQSETRIRGYYAMGRRVFLTGNTRLRELLDETSTLDAIVDALRRRKDPETGVAFQQMRFVGELECCLQRRNGQWSEYTQQGVGSAVVGLNVAEGIAYAIRLRPDGKPLEIVYAKVSEDPVTIWRHLALAPGHKYIIDAGRFVRDSDGDMVSLVSLEGNEYRLLTISPDGRIYWSDTISLPGEAIECDGICSAQCEKRFHPVPTILTQRWAVDGFLVSRHPVESFNGVVLCSYLRASS